MTSTAASYPRVVTPMYGGGGGDSMDMNQGGGGGYGRSSVASGVLSHRLVVCLTPENPSLHLSFLDNDVASIFNLCGPVRQCHTFIHPPRPSTPMTPSLPFAVVDFYSGPPAAEAVTSLNGTVLANLGTIQIHRLLPDESVEDKVQRVFASYLSSLGGAASDMSNSSATNMGMGGPTDPSMPQQPMILPTMSARPPPQVMSGTPTQGPMDGLKQSQNTDMGGVPPGAAGSSGMGGDGGTINAAEALKQLASLLHQLPPKQQQGNQPGQAMPPQQQQPPPQSNLQNSPYQQTGFPPNGAAGGMLPRNPTNAMYLARMEFVDLFGVEGFDVTSAVLGDRDRNIHFILEQADHKVSISLKGVPANDAPVAERLHMAITSSSKPHFDRAVDMAEDLLRAVCHKVISLCAQRRIKASSNIGFIKHLYVGDQTPDGMGTNFRYQGNVRHVNPPLHNAGGSGGPNNTSKRLRQV